MERALRRTLLMGRNTFSLCEAFKGLIKTGFHSLRPLPQTARRPPLGKGGQMQKLRECAQERASHSSMAQIQSADGSEGNCISERKFSTESLAIMRPLCKMTIWEHTFSTTSRT